MRALSVAAACLIFGAAPARADERPLVLEMETALGRLELEFLSLEQVQRRGAVIPAIEKAQPTYSPSTNFDRTDLVIHYVLALPILTF